MFVKGDWATIPVRTGWTMAIQYGRLPSGTLDAISVRGKAPSTEEGKAYLFEARLAEGPPDVLASGAKGSPPWWLLAGGPAVVDDGVYEFRSSHGLDQGRGVKWDGPKQEFRVLAQELRADEDTKRFLHALKDMSRDPSNYIGEAFVIGTGTTTLLRV
ncbi:hypothetical protein AB0B31_18400 [Catellatospora citrea]|uniref:hypothetical protein n=1 Tax=Catellatospora citrea TaxID=53366 RepID=UPI0034035E9D